MGGEGVKVTGCWGREDDPIKGWDEQIIEGVRGSFLQPLGFRAKQG